MNNNINIYNIDTHNLDISVKHRYQMPSILT